MTHLAQMLLVLLLQSTGLLVLGLAALRLTRRRGPAVQTLVGRAALASVALLMLLLPLTGHIQPVVRVGPPAQTDKTSILGSRSSEPMPPVEAPLPQWAGKMAGAAGANTHSADVRDIETQGASRSAPTVLEPLPPTPTPPPTLGGQALVLGGFLLVSAVLLL